MKRALRVESFTGRSRAAPDGHLRIVNPRSRNHQRAACRTGEVVVPPACRAGELAAPPAWSRSGEEADPGESTRTLRRWWRGRSVVHLGTSTRPAATVAYSAVSPTMPYETTDKNDGGCAGVHEWTRSREREDKHQTRGRIRPPSFFLFDDTSPELRDVFACFLAIYDYA